MLDPLTWNVLLNYESQDLVRRRFQQLHGKGVSAAQAKAVACAFYQGRSYFESAVSADRAIKPLLLYYGVISLTRGTILLFDAARREQTLAPKHGLSVYKWNQTFAQQPLDLGKLTISIEDSGTFREFLDVTRNCSLLRMVASGRVHKLWQHRARNIVVKLTLEDLVSRTPDLQSQFFRWKGMHRCMRAAMLEDDSEEGQQSVMFFEADAAPMSGQEAVEAFFGCLPSKQTQQKGNQIIVSAPATDEGWPPVWDMVVMQRGARFDGKSVNVVAPFEDGFDCSKPASCFILCYLLGMFARYYPSRWMSLTRNETGDAAFPTVSAALAYIERDFPWMISDLVDSRLAASTA